MEQAREPINKSTLNGQLIYDKGSKNIKWEKVNEAEVDVFWEFPCFFSAPPDVGNLITSSFAFSKSSLYIWNFSVHLLLKPSLKDFEHYFASMLNECTCIAVWTFFGITFL